MNILIAVDGSPFTKRMLAYLATHEEWLSPSHAYTVLHAVPAVPPRAAAVLDKDLLRKYYDDECEKVFKPIRAFVKRHGIAASYVHKAGPPAEVISKAAEGGNFDLLVMGSHGHSTLTNLVLGSVVTKVLAHCKTPLLIVR
jgi:nucleotide-binding universal stress UspA family protein